VDAGPSTTIRSGQTGWSLNAAAISAATSAVSRHSTAAGTPWFTGLTLSSRPPLNNPFCARLSDFYGMPIAVQNGGSARVNRLRVVSVERALPWFKVWFPRWQLSGAVPVEPGGGAALGMLLVDRVTVVVKFQDIGKDGEADLQLGRRLPNGVPVIDAIQHRMAG
jgi:hypothetical protein